MSMRQFCLALTALLGIAAPALAQVTVDLHALDALPGAKPAAKGQAAHKAAPKPDQRRTAAVKPKEPSSQPAAEAPAATPTVQTSPAPPPPTDQAAPPPPPPISDSATTAATKVGAGLRVTFGAAEADLSPASAEAIRNIVQTAPAGDGTPFNLVGYAAGTPEDPSTARRLSLSRALAVRNALMADGVTSSRIYVRALGATGGDEAPDRVDLAVMGGNAPAADAGAKSQTQ